LLCGGVGNKIKEILQIRMESPPSGLGYYALSFSDPPVDAPGLVFFAFAGMSLN
jgi:hypothetical protein